MKANRKIFRNDRRLEEQKKAFLKYLLDLGYVEASLQYHKQVTNSLEQYMYDNHEIEYTLKISADFLEHESKLLAAKPSILTKFKLAIRHYNTFLLGSEYTYRATTADRTCPEQFQSLLSDYLKNLNLQCLRERTIERHRDNLIKILQMLDSMGIGLSQDLRPSDIYNAFEQATDKHGFTATFRRFLRYLHEIGRLDTDMSQYVPHKRKAQSVPSVYTKPEVNQFICSFDTECKIGKRDYAIALLALRLGIRSSDISNLKIQDIDFDAKTINFTQGKTQVPQRLELLPEVDDAIYAYLNDARQESPLDYLFVTTRTPIRKLSIQFIRSMVGNHLKASGIEIGERKQGPHSLRMTLASELVSENVPYDVVRRILGHEDPSSMKHYVSFDIEGLRGCALAVPPITGQLSDYIYATKGGAF
jgi:integrase